MLKEATTPDVRDELLAAYAELGRLEKMKGAFVARASHELRTPVTVAKLACEVAESQAQREDVRRALGLASSAIARLERRIEDVLLFSSLDGRTPLERRELDLAALLRDAEKEHAPLAAELGVDAKLLCRAGSLPALAHEPSISRAFLHLYHNAVRFSRRGGVVRVAVEATREKALIRFRDSAEPVPAAEADQIFEGFYQAAEHMTRKHDGLGLGLVIARRAVERHGGRLKLESFPYGNVFSVELPRR